MDVYNVATRTWSTAQLSVARRLLSAASVGNLAIFAGGHSGRTFVNQCRGLLVAAIELFRVLQVCNALCCCYSGLHLLPHTIHCRMGHMLPF